ncbi:MAG: pyridoxamine 5'-phosphate oxidase, partial [Flavobacteriaceae bacterium]
GVPHTRIVLLKAYSSAGFIFYTNYNSQKGKAIAQNAQVCLSFFWAPLERQIRINGTAIKLDEATSTAYFNSRPKGSQLGAHASPQSEQIDSPTVLEGRLKSLQETYANKDIPKPTHWGGYLVQPKEIEFWQGRPNRLHHRVVCRLTEHGWNMGYLAP